MKNEINNRAFEHNPAPNQDKMRKEYEKYAETRHLIVNELKDRVEQILVPLHSTPTVSGRIKSFDSFFRKHLRLRNGTGKDVLITDLLGIRVICPFIEDLEPAEELIKEHFKIDEVDRKGHYTFKEFGYESTHLLITIPDEIIVKYGNPGTNIAEFQLRTILQDAWAEVEHELVYKAQFDPSGEPMKRKLAAVNASLTLADIIFQEIRSHQRKYSSELEKRRRSFYQKIEEETDELLFSGERFVESDIPIADVSGSLLASLHSDSIDDLLVNALTAHNDNCFNDAISLYSRILELNPNDTIRSTIFKHRGMAYFACSQYSEAIEDFSRALEFDEKSYKAAYYRGGARSVIKQYSLAIDDYSLSLAINPYQSFCLFRRGQAYYHVGDYIQALSDCETSIALESQNKSAVKFRNLLLDKLRM
ncbi:MAG: (p)ppGpp synthetase [Treponema sp.]|jgi:putative GTP pyrophosphokinase|nr:(p)ppGpp synthetase [Treponema sp.]